MKQIAYLIACCAFVSCVHGYRESDETKCLPTPFAMAFEEVDVYLKATYNSCEVDWKYRLQIFKGDRLIYAADTSSEFEFNQPVWPQYKRIDAATHQLLIEQNDRPAKNKILLLTIQGDQLIQETRIPYFEEVARDWDEDGIHEYLGQWEALEPFHPDSSIYNPFLLFEDRSNGFYLDSAATISYNQQLWGAFYGFEVREDLRLTRKE